MSTSEEISFPEQYQDPVSDDSFDRSPEPSTPLFLDPCGGLDEHQMFPVEI